MPNTANIEFSRDYDPSEKLVAVIDVGSNSVRLVINAAPSLEMPPIFEKKVNCRLAEGIQDTGYLSAQSKALTLETLKDFSSTLQALDIYSLIAVGTAPFRDAKDGEDFAKDIIDETGIPLEIISGEQEAHYAARAVLQNFPDANGLVADLGGGSVDIARITAKGNIKHALSLPLGGLILKSIEESNGEAAVRAHIREALANLNDKTAQKLRKTDRLYALGGSWRNISKVFSKSSDLAFENRDDQHHVLSKEFCQFSNDLATKNVKALSDLGISEKRLDLVGPAAWLMDELSRWAKLDEIVLNRINIRDGIFAETVSTMANDPINLPQPSKLAA